jgi:FAD-dependent monooxygenase
MTLALELSAHGVRSLLVERNPETTKFPKMDITNARSMELLRRLGIAEEIRAAGVAPEHSFDVIFASGLDGRELARWPLPSQAAMREEIAGAVDGSLPREPWQRISQERMEVVLMRRCLADPHIEVMRPWRVVAVEQDADGVTATVAHGVSGEERELTAGWLAGCEGAHSVAREALGVGLEGTPDIVGTSCQVHFRSRDRETLHRFGQFWHLFMPRAVGRVSIIAQDEIDTWTMQAMVPPGTAREDIDPIAFVHDRTGTELEIDRVLQHNLWRPQALVAERYGRGRVWLAGDAAHQVIPTGGYGMNTGLGDAVDLGWKLAAVIQGWGGPRLLESYDAERRPVADANRDWSVRHFRVHMQASQMVNEDGPLEGATADATGLRERVARHYTSSRGENESAGQELGYAYADSPVIASDGDVPRGVMPADPLRYEPTTLPGARAPHVWLADGTSLLDAFGRGFVLVDFDGKGAALSGAGAGLGVPVRHLPVADARAREIYERDLVLVRPDGHVAWRGDVPPDDAGPLFDLVTGR